MPEHCRECTTLGRGACDCAALLAGRLGYDAIAKPLLHSALGEKWMGMEDMTEEYIPHKVAPLKREETGLLRMLDANKREGEEITGKLNEVRRRIKETMGESGYGDE